MHAIQKNSQWWKTPHPSCEVVRPKDFQTTVVYSCEKIDTISVKTTDPSTKMQTYYPDQFTIVEKFSLWYKVIKFKDEKQNIVA